MSYNNQILIDYLPAELHEAETGWYISYYVANPATGKLVRKRIKFNRITSITARRQAAKQLCQKINLKLAAGWNPLIEQDAPLSYTYVDGAVKTFIKQQQKAAKDGAIRPDTLRSYSSYANVFTKWWAANKKAEPYTHALTPKNITEFLEWVYYDQDNTPRTHNNYLSYLHTMLGWMANKGYCKTNAAASIQPKKTGPKQRSVIPEPILQKIWQHTSQQPAWQCLCQFVFYTFIRRTELTLLKISDLNFQHQTVTIAASFSKNKKTQAVTLPKSLALILAAHIGSAPGNHYIFSANQFTPGPLRLQPKKISDTWAAMRKALKLPKQYQFYSLKDTGITTMLQQNVPTIAVRDQARHHDISMTNQYTPAGTGIGAEIIRKL